MPRSTRLSTGHLIQQNYSDLAGVRRNGPRNNGVTTRSGRTLPGVPKRKSSGTTGNHVCKRSRQSNVPQSSTEVDRPFLSKQVSELLEIDKNFSPLSLNGSDALEFGMVRNDLFMLGGESVDSGVDSGSSASGGSTPVSGADSPDLDGVVPMNFSGVSTPPVQTPSFTPFSPKTSAVLTDLARGNSGPYEVTSADLFNGDSTDSKDDSEPLTPRAVEVLQSLNLGGPGSQTPVVLSDLFPPETSEETLPNTAALEGSLAEVHSILSGIVNVVPQIQDESSI